MPEGETQTPMGTIVHPLVRPIDTPYNEGFRRIAFGVLNMEADVITTDDMHAVVQPSLDRMCVHIDLIRHDPANEHVRFTVFSDRIELRHTHRDGVAYYVYVLLQDIHVKDNPVFIGLVKGGALVLPLPTPISVLHDTSAWAVPPSKEFALHELQSSVEFYYEEERANDMRTMEQFLFEASHNSPSIVSAHRAPPYLATANAGTTVVSSEVDPNALAIAYLGNFL